MNPSLGTSTALLRDRLRFGRNIQRDGRIFDRGVGIDGGPRQSDDDDFPLGHLAITDTGHHAIAGNVFGKTVYKNLFDSVRLDQILVVHETSLQPAEDDPSTDAAREPSQKYYILVMATYPLVSGITRASVGMTGNMLPQERAA